MKKTLSLMLALLLTLTLALGATAYPQGGNNSWSKEINKGGKNIVIKKGPNGQFEKSVNGETVVKKDSYTNYNYASSTPDVAPAPSTPVTPAPVAPAAPAPQTPVQEVPSEVTEVLNRVNEERAKIGAAPLTLDPTLTSAATTRAGELFSSFSHTRPDGSKWSTALDAVGIINVARAENIAKGQVSATKVMDAWMNSSGHATNILNNNYTKIGVGLVDSGGSLGWVQLFSA